MVRLLPESDIMMIAWLDDEMRELARELRLRYDSYPAKSPEYTIMMQDLSRRPPSSIPLLPAHTRIGMRTQKLYDALYIARREYQELYELFYLRRLSRRRRMKMLNLRDKNKYYALRDDLHSYILGLMDSKKDVRTTDTMGGG